MGLVKEIKDSLLDDSSMCSTTVRQTMTLRRFQKLYKYFHLNINNTTQMQVKLIMIIYLKHYLL